MSSLTSKLPFLLAPLAIAISAPLSAATPGAYAPAIVNAPFMLRAAPAKAVSLGPVSAPTIWAWPNVYTWPFQAHAIPNDGLAIQAPSKGLPAADSNIRDTLLDREARDAIDYGNIASPGYLIVQNLGRRAQLQAIGAPLPPIEGENAGGQIQVRVPFLSLAW